jgi:N-methylhydantoinase B
VVAGQPAAENVIFSGTRPGAAGSRPGSGGTWVVAESTAIGWGAHARGDGASAMVNYGAGDLKNLSIEVLEARFPLRVNHYGYRRGSGGTGLHCGGDGVTANTKRWPTTCT